MADAQIYGKELLKVQIDGQLKNLLVLRREGSTNLFDAHPLVEAFNIEHRTDLKIISHEVSDVALNVGNPWSLPNTLVVDASIAYEKPGKRLGEEIVFAAQDEPKVVLATGKYQGEKDVALVALGITSADFKKDVDSITLDISDNRLITVPNFPGPDGWYMPHKQTGVPHGEQVASSPDARYLWRFNDSSYVGLLVRVRSLGYSSGGFYGDGRVVGEGWERYVRANCWSSIKPGGSGRSTRSRCRKNQGASCIS